MPRKKLKGLKRRNAERKSGQISNQQTEYGPEASESTDALKNWLEDVCINMENDDMETYDVPEIDQMELEELEDENNECNLKELEKPLTFLLRKYPDAKIKKLIKIECEWKKCLYETIDDKAYLSHVHNHLLEVKDSQTFSCQWNLCRFETENYEEFIRHLDYHAYHTKLKTFGFALVNIISVPICQADSKFRNVIPSIPDNYHCYWNECHEIYTTFIDFIQHVNHHIADDFQTGSSAWKHSDRIKLKDIPVDCLWMDCESRKLPNIFELKRHLKTHTNEKMIGCSNCGHLFATKQLFIGHCMRQVVGQRTFKCTECVKFYPSEKLLKDHIRSHINKYQCSICGLSCQKKSVLARHIRYRHVTNKPFTCSQCSYKGTTKRDLESHSNSHKSGDFFKCDVFQCNYSCRTLMALKRHDAREHLGQPAFYICHLYGCNKKFLRGYLLTKHLKADHDFISPPGHSRFIYKQDEDGFYRLQTKRVENLKETKYTGDCASPIGSGNAVGVSYEIDKIENGTDLVSIHVRQTVQRDFDDDLIKKSETKDINEFAIVKNYNKLLTEKIHKNL